MDTDQLFDTMVNGNWDSFTTTTTGEKFIFLWDRLFIISLLPLTNTTRIHSFSVLSINKYKYLN